MGNHRFSLFLVAALAPWCFWGCGGAKQEVASGAEAVNAEPAPAAESGASVQIEGLLGTLPQDDVERAIERRNDAIAACYQEALDVSEQIEGSLEIALEIAADGSVASAHLRNGTLGSLDAESCILDVARRIVFPAPRGGPRASIVYPLALEKPYDGPAPAELDGAEKDAVVRERAADVERCLGGATGVQLTVYVGRDGRVISAGASSDALGAAQGASCLAAAARAWSFPAPGPNGAKGTIAF